MPCFRFFDGGQTSKVERNGYEEAFPIPKAPRQVLERAIGEAVKSGAVWLVAGPASIFKEEIPLGVLTDAATLNPPPPDIRATAALPQNLQTAWVHDVTTGSAIASALSAAHGKQLPWPVVAAAIEGAIRSRLLERADDSGPWPCDWPSAASVRLRIPSEAPPAPSPAPPPASKCAEAMLGPAELQDLADCLGEILKAGAGLDLQFILPLELPAGTVAPERIASLNDVLAKVSAKLRLV